MTECSYPRCNEKATQVFIERVKNRNLYRRKKYEKRKTEFCDKHIKDRWILVWKIWRKVWFILPVLLLPYIYYKIQKEKRTDSIIWAGVKKKPIEEVD